MARWQGPEQKRSDYIWPPPHHLLQNQWTGTSAGKTHTHTHTHTHSDLDIVTNKLFGDNLTFFTWCLAQLRTKRPILTAGSEMPLRVQTSKNLFFKCFYLLCDLTFFFFFLQRCSSIRAFSPNKNFDLDPVIIVHANHFQRHAEKAVDVHFAVVGKSNSGDA